MDTSALLCKNCTANISFCTHCIHAHNGCETHACGTHPIVSAYKILVSKQHNLSLMCFHDLYDKCSCIYRSHPSPTFGGLNDDSFIIYLINLFAFFWCDDIFCLGVV
jgi:hypothetical protein